MPTISCLGALEILDSRGRPTLEVRCSLTSGATATAQVPSGASTGTAEALELRDGDPSRYAGLGCRTAAKNVTETLQAALAGTEFPDQTSLDHALLDLDGTPNKARLGANAILGVSLSFARAQAEERHVPLFRHFTEISGLPTVARLPRPTINLFSGGKHAGGQVAIQDVLLVPISANTIDESLEHVTRVFRAAADLAQSRLGSRALVADEGGLAPGFASADAMLEMAVEAIEKAGFKPGIEMSLAVDVAATHFRSGSQYQLDGAPLNADAMIDRLESWVRRFPLISVEDGLAEDAWSDWPRLVQRLKHRTLVLGDDFLCTQPVRIRRAIQENAATALLLKVNQVGTLTEAATALQLARGAGWHVTISARSGETEDTWLADLATGWAGDHIKIGSVTRSERLAKYNRLLAIEQCSGLAMAPARS